LHYQFCNFSLIANNAVLTYSYSFNTFFEDSFDCSLTIDMSKAMSKSHQGHHKPAVKQTQHSRVFAEPRVQFKAPHVAAINFSALSSTSADQVTVAAREAKVPEYEIIPGPSSIPRLRGLLSSKDNMFRGLKPIKTRLFSLIQNPASSAGTALAFNSLVQMESAYFPEYTSYSTLYDECRILKWKVHYYFSTSVAGVNPNLACAIAIMFDPSAPTPTGVNTILEESYNSGLHIVSPVATASNTFPMQKYKTLTAHCPPLAPITTADCPGSAWFTVDAGTPPYCMVIQMYSTNPGSTGIAYCSYVIELEVEFRMRT
jgi:hypothetical protein